MYEKSVRFRKQEDPGPGLEINGDLQRDKAEVWKL